MSLSSLIYERDQYVRAKSQVLSTASHLNSARSSVSSALESESNGYSVDGSCTDNNFLGKICTAESDLYSKIVGEIVPRIDNNVSRLNTLISREQERLREEALKREKESRREL